MPDLSAGADGGVKTARLEGKKDQVEVVKKDRRISSCEERRTEGVMSPINDEKQMQIDFVRMTRHDPVMQEAYRDLAFWHNHESEEVKFENYLMKGHLRKFHQNSMLFKKDLNPHRFVVVDFNNAIIKIYKKKPDIFGGDGYNLDDKEMTQLKFRDVIDCIQPSSDKQHSKEWPFPFYVTTVQRMYIFSSKTE